MSRRKIQFQILLALLMTAIPLMMVLAASTDFENFAAGTSANAISVSGMTFSTSATNSPWEIYPGYTFPPAVVGNVLGSFGGDTLTINFNLPQGSITFGYGSFSNSTVKLYHTGALVSTQTLPTSGAGVYQFATISFAGGFDKLELFSASDIVIDNINTDAGYGSGVTLPCSDDSRLNNYDCAAPVAIYCRADGGIDLYAINDQSQGILALHVTSEQIEKLGIPAEKNVTLASQGPTTLYRLTGGEFQVNTTYPQDGKAYVFVWDACPVGSSYTLAH